MFCDDLDAFESLHFLEQLAAHLGWASGNDDARLLEGIDLVLGSTLSSGDDGTSVTHATAGRRRQTGDERHNRLGFDALKRI